MIHFTFKVKVEIFHGNTLLADEISEPDTFSIDDLIQCNNQIEPWDGIRNYQARNMMRDQMKIGDLAFFYHSSCKVRCSWHHEGGEPTLPRSFTI